MPSTPRFFGLRLSIPMQDDFPEMTHAFAGQAELEVLSLLPGSELDKPLGLGAFCLPDLTAFLAIGREPEREALCTLMKLGCLPVFHRELPQVGGLLELDDDVRLVRFWFSRSRKSPVELLLLRQTDQELLDAQVAPMRSDGCT